LDRERVLAHPLEQRLVGRNREIDVRKRYLQDDDKGHDEEQQQPQIRQRNHESAPRDADSPETPGQRCGTNESPPPGWSPPRKDTPADPNRLLRQAPSNWAACPERPCRG